MAQPTPELSQAYTALSDFEGMLDAQIYPEQLRDNFDAPDDCEYAVTITAGQWRAFGLAINVLEKPRDSEAEARLLAHAREMHAELAWLVANNAEPLANDPERLARVLALVIKAGGK